MNLMTEPDASNEQTQEEEVMISPHLKPALAALLQFRASVPERLRTTGFPLRRKTFAGYLSYCRDESLEEVSYMKESKDRSTRQFNSAFASGACRGKGTAKGAYTWLENLRGHR